MVKSHFMVNPYFNPLFIQILSILMIKSHLQQPSPHQTSVVVLKVKVFERGEGPDHNGPEVAFHNEKRMLQPPGVSIPKCSGAIFV